MGLIWSRLRRLDPDVTFGYTTYKVVKVRDRYLGLLYYGSVVCIFGYILYNIFAQELYYKKSSPIAGFVRATAKLDIPLSSPLPSYCSIPPPNSTNTVFGGCLRWTAQQAVFPYDGELNSVFLTTRVTIARTPTPGNVSAGCTDFDGGCRPPSFDEVRASTTVTTYYLANVEDLTLRLDHGVRVHYGASMFGASSRAFSAKDMVGRMLMGCSGNEELYRLSWGPAYRTNATSTNHLDTFSIRDLLISANCLKVGQVIDLEGQSSADGAKKGESLRSAGFVISSPITYMNGQKFGTGEYAYKYVYSPAKMEGTEYKVLQTRVNPDGSLTYLNRHGIRIVFDQTGQIGEFDFIALLTALVAATALLRVATLTVEVLMLWIMPHRILYSKAKFESTEDFSDIRDLLNDEGGKRVNLHNINVRKKTSVKDPSQIHAAMEGSSRGDAGRPVQLSKTYEDEEERL
ncbi:hypothetical protein DFS34DRAFT_151907 [Phlyctochytrium arcticum]|nr:hypothetical protein DFS34DRAFT_151907 [Phlyctochytrium arcticum]